jgi:endonuclease/exonuclease/phosphatase family metal-dependent hydrolase
MPTRHVHASVHRPRTPGVSRNTAVAAVIVAAVLTLLTAMLTVPGTASAEPRHGPRVLRVMSYNIHTGIGTDGVSDLGRIASVIRDADVDVVALQEVDVHWADRSDYVDQATELARLTDMSVYFAPIYDLDPEPGREERRRYGVAVLSRHPVLSATNHEISRLSTVEPGAEPEPMPGFAEVVVSVRGLPVHVYNTHLDYRPDPTVRSRQVTEMLDILRQDPPRAHQLLLGDFNAEPAAPELAPLFERLRDAWGTRGGGLTYPAEDPVKRIDYITAGGGVRVLNASVPAVEASDHRPVVATLLLR